MLVDEEWLCPLCGEICGSLTGYHRHSLREHDGARVVWNADERPKRDGLTLADYGTPAEEIAGLQ